MCRSQNFVPTIKIIYDSLLVGMILRFFKIVADNFYFKKKRTLTVKIKLE